MLYQETWQHPQIHFGMASKKKKEREYAKNREEYFKEFHRVIAPVVVLNKYDSSS